ncbi:MAG: HEAT repeat domain-containing protein [Acidobacteria bacterium]|nr:HEAT repeat domain-containing protein [Acidobacteriota bacterium]
MLRSLPRRPGILPAAMLALVVVACGERAGPPDVAGMIADLTSGDAKKSGEARLQLISLGESAAPALAGLLRNGGPHERVLAATTLWGMGVRGRAAVPDLAAALKDPDPDLRVTCTMALENMGPAARDAVPALARALNDRERSVRQAAVKALGAIGPAASPALPALEREIKRESWPEAEEAVRRIREGASSSEAGR